jgi:hypothetical protein
LSDKILRSDVVEEKDVPLSNADRAGGGSSMSSDYTLLPGSKDTGYGVR